MATVNITYDLADGGSLVIDTGGTNSLANPLILLANESVNFVNLSSGVGNRDVTISSLRADQFTSSSNFTIAKGSSTSRSILNSPAFTSDSVTITAGSFTEILYIDVDNGIDDSPNSFSIGVNIFAAELNTSYEFPEFRMSGTNVDVAASIVGGQFAHRTNSGSYGTWLTSAAAVPPGSWLKVRGTSSSAFASTLQITLTLGGVADFVTVKTKINPQDGTKILFPHTSPGISLKKVTEFFSAPLSAILQGANPPRFMSAFRRGGLHVPDITENLAIADTNQANNLDLSSFEGAYTSFYLINSPQNKSQGTNVLGGSQTASLSWTTLIDWTLGYSTEMRYNAEYRFELEEIVGTGPTAGSGAVLSASTATPGVYSPNNTSFAVSATSTGTFEEEFSGEVVMYIRSLLDSNIVLTHRVGYTFNFYGQ